MVHAALVRASTHKSGEYPKGFLPYDHMNDNGHDPNFELRESGSELVIEGNHLFKLKPNYEKKLKNRIDIYFLAEQGASLVAEIKSLIGQSGSSAPLANVNPSAYRRGDVRLPDITQDSMRVQYNHASVELSNYVASGTDGRIFIDPERPRPEFAEMTQGEIHLGLRLNTFTGDIDAPDVTEVDVPIPELRAKDEQNPVSKADGTIEIRLEKDQGRELASAIDSFIAVI